MPDQSQQYERSGKTDTGAGQNPSDTSANHPEAASQASVESNVTRVSEGQETQASQTIEGDPHVGVGNLAGDLDATPRGASDSDGPSDNYDDEDAWPYRALQQEAKNRHLPGDGKRPELIARLREADKGNADLTAGVSDPNNPPVSDDGPRGDVQSGVVDNGGIQRTEFAQKHAEILQGLSAERRQQQLEAVKERAGSRNQARQAEDGDEAERDGERVNA